MSKTFRAGRAAAALGVGAAASFFAAYGGVKQAFRYQLDGRVIVITGGSRSLGLAMARQFLRRGAKVALLGRDPETLERARQLLAGKGTVFVRPCDVSNAEQIRAAITDIRQKLGEIDVLVNNAGTITVGPMDSMTADEYRESLEIFFWAAFNAASAVLPYMRQRRSGRIINISSIGGKISVPHLLPYSVGKSALAGYCEGLRAELARDNVRVTTVFPGLMRTGSPRNADFTGKHRAEDTWFLLSDAIPGLSINADRAARQMVNACEHGKAELIVSLPAKIAIKFHSLLPAVTSRVLETMARILPGNEITGAQQTPQQPKRKGGQSETRLTESWLTALDERAARINNQVQNPTPVAT